MVTTPNEVAERLDRAARDALASGEAPRIDYDTASRAAEIISEYVEWRSRAELAAIAEAPEPLVERLRAALKDTLASLVAAHSLLCRSPKTAAPSNTMFDQMTRDYAASIERGRAALSSSISNAEPEDSCSSCHGLNLSCPDGCERDPMTGELNGSRTEDSGEVVRAEGGNG